MFYNTSAKNISLSCELASSLLESSLESNGISSACVFAFKNESKSKVKAQTKVTTKTDVKVVPISQYAPQQSDANKPCTTAKISHGDVVRGERLTIEESVNHVRMNNDVMCDTRDFAFQVASNFKNFYEEGAHHNGVKGYYPHFHPWNGYGHPHIWFYEM